MLAGIHFGGPLITLMQMTALIGNRAEGKANWLRSVIKKLPRVSTMSVMLEVSKARRAIDKKARRGASRKARQDGLGIEGVITSLAASLRPVKARPLDMDKLYNKARQDMGIRTKLTLDGRTNPGAAKRRRQLNDWEIDTDPQGAGDSWQEDQSKRRAVGRCSIQAVDTKANFKRNGAHFTN